MNFSRRVLPPALFDGVVYTDGKMLPPPGFCSARELKGSRLCLKTPTLKGHSGDGW